MVDRVIDIRERTPDEEDYLVVLGNLIADFEDEHEPADVSPADMLRHLLEAKGVTQTEVAKGTGLSNATISHVLVGHRQPSRRVITALAAYFKVDPAVFF